MVRAEATKQDLQAIMHYIRENRPVLIGVDGGADALLENGLKPDIVVGDMDSISDKALHCRCERIVTPIPTAGRRGWRG